MFIKTFKKSIALFTVLVFVLSLVSFSVLAEIDGGDSAAKTATLPFLNVATSRKGKGFQEISYTYYVRATVAGSNERFGYSQIDFTGYEEILGNDSTDITAYYGAGRNASYPAYSYVIRGYAGNLGDYDASTVTYAQAEDLGLHNTSGAVLYERTETTAQNGEWVTVDINDDAVKSLITNNSSVISLCLSTSYASDTRLQWIPGSKEPGFVISYKENEIDNAAYVDSILNEITWETVSADEENYVVNPVNLIKKYKGATITWSSSNEDVLSSSSGEVVPNANANSKIALTATVTYTSALGETVSKDKTFNVVVPKPVVPFTVNYDGTSKIPTNASGPVQTIVDGFGGKEAGDKVIAFTNGSTRYLNPSVAGARNFEVSVYVPNNNGCLTFAMKAYTPTEAAGGSIEYRVDSAGLHTNYSGGPVLQKAWEPNQWHTITFAAPAILETDSAGNPTKTETNFKIYVDNQFVQNRLLNAENIYTATTTDETTGETTTTVRTGINRVRMSGHATDPIYIDNMRWTTENYADFSKYSGMASVESTVYDIDNSAKVISYKDVSLTVDELVSNLITDDDTVVKVLRGKGTDSVILDDDVTITNNDYVVLAARNGTNVERTYNYYSLNKVKNEFNVSPKINGAYATKFDSDDDIYVSADFYNYTGDETYDVTMYTAQYRYGELVKLWQDSKTVTAGEKANFECDFEGMEERTGSVIKIMLVDNELNPYAKAEQLRFNNEDTEATLYLLGDSIVQTYVDPGYPIQGWGYYIENYLNDNIKVENRATSGWTTDHYLYPDGIYTRENGVTSSGEELRSSSGSLKKVGESNRYKVWANVLEELKPGDYVMVSLGINDMGSGNVPDDRYLENIDTIFNQASAKGATVIFSTPTISGRDWDTTAGFGEGWGGYGVICKEYASKNNTICIPLGATLVNTYTDMVNQYMAENPDATSKDAKNYVRNYFHIYAENGTPPEGWSDFGVRETDDSTHHNVVSSNVVAKIVATLIKDSGSSLGDYVVIP